MKKKGDRLSSYEVFLARAILMYVLHLVVRQCTTQSVTVRAFGEDNGTHGQQLDLHTTSQGHCAALGLTATL